MTCLIGAVPLIFTSLSNIFTLENWPVKQMLKSFTVPSDNAFGNVKSDGCQMWSFHCGKDQKVMWTKCGHADKTFKANVQGAFLVLRTADRECPFLVGGCYDMNCHSIIGILVTIWKEFPCPTLVNGGPRVLHRPPGTSLSLLTHFLSTSAPFGSTLALAVPLDHLCARSFLSVFYWENYLSLR